MCQNYSPNKFVEDYLGLDGNGQTSSNRTYNKYFQFECLLSVLWKKEML